ncbi:hypothetical protein P20429_2261 [Pseudoalteromonas sp. BSi20429]|nr:hypothetical protein P20429_2261 [Pseudoalteromonas sp. BSi20429]
MVKLNTVLKWLVIKKQLKNIKLIFYLAIFSVFNSFFVLIF